MTGSDPLFPLIPVRWVCGHAALMPGDHDTSHRHPCPACLPQHRDPKCPGITWTEPTFTAPTPPVRRCGTCKTTAADATRVALYAEGWRCDPCSPWSRAGREDPRYAGQYCVVPLHKHQTPDAATWGVVDARAIATGKRRASPGQQAAARRAVADQTARRRAAGGRR